jgi:hypothetical protein
MVTKNWTSKVGLSRFPNNAHEAFFAHKWRDFTGKNFNIQARKKCILQFSQKLIDLRIYFL